MLSGEYIRQNFPLKRNPCYGCSLAHCHTLEVPSGAYAGFEGEEPEYEDFSQLGSNLGISDPGAVVMLTDYIDRLGFDSNWAGATIGFAMEAYERGVLTGDDLDGLDLTWGNAEAAKELIYKVAHREGIGDVLARGLKKAAEAIGGDAPQFAVHFKGEANHAHDSRALWGQFLGLAISGAGPRWEAEGMDLLPDPELGVTAPEDRFDPKPKPESARKTQMKKLFNDSLGTCMFGSSVGLDLVSEAYTALTGRPMDKEEALRVGERIANVQRAFNIRHGFQPEFDLDVSPRLLEAPPDGGAAGKTIAPYFKDMVFEYNRLMGWDVETGKPHPQTLQRLGLEEMLQIS
jgi:aldehyde:ferredoxin oxidoreductase